MKIKDIFLFSSFSIVSQKLRSFLTALGIGVGVLCVIFLTSMGQGLQDFIVGQFTQFGSNIIAVQPGKTQTLGAPMGIHGTMKPLSFGDTEAIEKLPLVEYAVPVSGANGEIESDTRLRRSLVVGTGADYDKIVGADTMLGQYLPKDNAKTPRSFVVLGPKMRDVIL